ncbi:MAG: DUF1501 domain-containing protein [Planctomycetes bacterium]|nr:DUF1501 domain-containing protein [Planctomycetota bacterium]
MNLSRRTFLRIAGVGALSLALPELALRRLVADDAKPLSQTPPGPSLVVVFLRGGADALNILVPWADKRYYDLRPSIAILPEKTQDAAGVIKLDKTFGLHPSLAALKPHFDASRLAPICCVGSPHSTRSHFDAQDFMERGAPGARAVNTGWLNRYLNATNKNTKSSDEQLRAVAMQSLLPRALRGDFPVLAVPDERVLNDGQLMGLFDKIYNDGKKNEPAKEGMGEEKRENSVEDTGKDTVETLKRYKEILKRPIDGNRARFPEDALGKRLKDVATVIRAGVGLEVASFDINGWDDHVNEGDQLSTRLKSLGDGLAAFVDDLGEKASNTLVVVMTEFGRTCRENGNEGTDHGHGGCMLLMGGKLKGGKVHGQWTGLEEKDLYEKRDLAVTTDYRDVFAEVLRGHLKFDSPKDFFPEYSPKPVAGLF